jgi:hypothetical protein
MTEIIYLFFVILFGFYCVIFTHHAAKMMTLFLKMTSRLAGKDLGTLKLLANIGSVRALGILNLILAVVLYGKLE